ncbi:CPBP family intramembrane glutamic endopeptidase [Synoicihabitans lomoniglobus]|uniref:CPBP family intramembrane metalloprotease n=1 Tax=Synoicihabitans lomoniglobus TaxID=2909285 RepID=A0AAF0I6H3_9BACT|nr:CPBP family intramembrane metalloprotease [Opitutaceae bacterium LMO-M01]WED66091.1 CPBP family intramembrane metalloprotease [Opitutaceae bacterium LMO-M01]
MPAESLDLNVLLALSGQILMLLCGVGVLWRLMFSAEGRAAQRGPKPLPPWSINGAEFGMAVLAVVAGGIAGQIAAVLIAAQLTTDENVMLTIGGAGFQGGLLAGAGIAYISILKPAQRNAARGHDEPPALPGTKAVNLWIAGPYTLLAAMPVLFVVNLTWVFLLESLGLSVEKQELVNIFAETDSPIVLIGMSFLAVVVAPLVEEVIFRAGLFRFLRTRLPRWAAFVLPAAIFGSLHGNLVAFMPLFMLGIVFAVAYERTGRISVPILAHALFNLNTILLLLAGVEV